MFKHPFIIGFFFLGLIGILITTQQIQLPQIFLPKANVLGVTISILPANTSLEVGQETSFDINLNPADESVSAVELNLNFDQTVIEVTDIKPTQELPQLLGLDLSKPGRASAILLVSPGTNKTVQGVIARVYIKAKKAGNSSLKFDQSTKVSAIGKIGDVTGANEGSEITVSGGSTQVPLSKSSQQPPNGNTEADSLIKQYIQASNPPTEASKDAGIVNITNDYIKKIVEQINASIEAQARKWLD